MDRFYAKAMKECEHLTTVYQDTADGCLIVTCNDCDYKDICIPVENPEITETPQY